MSSEWNCRKCSGKCNTSGYPSAMKGSDYCMQQRKLRPISTRQGLFSRFFFSNKGNMRARGRK